MSTGIRSGTIPVKPALGGWVDLYISGRKINRFLSLCIAHGIMVRKVRYQTDGSVMCRIKAREFGHLIPLRRKTGVHIEITAKCGLPLWVKHHPWMYRILLAVICMVLLKCEYTSRIWYMKFAGAQEITQAQLEEALQSVGFYYGIPSHDIATDRLEKSIMEYFPSLTWCNIYLDRNRMRVYVREGVVPQDISEVPLAESGVCSQLVANQSGTITSMVTRSGTPKVHVGDVVAPGDLLIDGIEEIYDDSGTVKDHLWIPADGDIVARVNLTYTKDIPLQQEVYYNSGRESWRILFGYAGTYIALEELHEKYPHKKVDETFWRVPVGVGNPAWIGLQHVREQQLQLRSLRDEEAAAAGEHLFANYLLELQEQEICVENYQYHIVREGDGYVVKGLVVGTCSIGSYHQERIQIDEHE